MVIYNNDLENNSSTYNTPPVDPRIVNHITVDHSNLCIYFGVASAFWLLCFILGMIYAVIYKLDFYIRLPIILISISFAILSLRNAALWNACKTRKVQEGWNNRQCAEMRDRTSSKETQIRELIVNYNDKMKELNNSLNQATQKNIQLENNLSAAIDDLVGKYYQKITNDANQFQNTLKTESSWNTQYDNIQSYANQMNAALKQIYKNTRPLQYTQDQNVYNSK